MERSKEEDCGKNRGEEKIEETKGKTKAKATIKKRTDIEKWERG